MHSLRVAVIDDEPLVRRGLLTFLANEPEIVVVGEARDGDEAVALLREARPDVAFLDVQMPSLDGFGVLDALAGEPLPAIVFVTAYDAYALRAFDVHAVDYLLKPFDEERFRTALERVRSRLFGPNATTDRAALHAAMLAAVQAIRGGVELYAERLLVRHEDATIVVSANDLDWIEAADNYVRLHTGAARYLMRETIGSLERRLDPRRFARVHRSAIVNLTRVRELRPAFNGETIVLLSTGERLTLTRTYRDAFRERLGR